MKDRTVLATGLVGGAVTMLCCFTPALVVVLGAFGLSAWLGWADYVLLPAMALFLATIGYGLHLRRSRIAAACCEEGATGESPQLS